LQNNTGRINGIAVDPSDPNVIYIAAADGGAWKTKNGGQTWIPLFDNGPNSPPIFGGAIAIDPRDPRIIYFGSGDAQNGFTGPYGITYYGSGVYKSTDSGRTWTLLTTPGNLNPCTARVFRKSSSIRPTAISTSPPAIIRTKSPTSPPAWPMSVSGALTAARGST